MRNRDGSPTKTAIRTALLSSPSLGPRLVAAEAAMRSAAAASGADVANSNGNGQGASYALINTALAARAVGYM